MRDSITIEKKYPFKERVRRLFISREKIVINVSIDNGGITPEPPRVRSFEIGLKQRVEAILYKMNIKKVVRLEKEPLYKDLLERIDMNWEEDFSHENGNYTNRCAKCKKFFLGHKRRVGCRKCLT